MAAAAAGALAALALAMPSAASAATDTTSYQATLDALNGSNASGDFTLSLNGDQATITEHVSGLAAKLPASLGGGAYPHVQHIHIDGQGQCPTMSADKNGDGIVDTVEGQPAYGAIGTTLSTSGDTSPAAATNIKVAPTGSDFTYSRTITLDSKTVSALQSGKAVIVVHGLDPATLSKQAQSEKSHLVPSLPLAATSPALCGVVTQSQMSGMPTGSSPTGGGSTAGLQDEVLFGLGGGLLLAAGGAFAARRRFGSQS
jgi:hypothetical protein